MKGPFFTELKSALIDPSKDPRIDHTDLRIASVLVPLADREGSVSVVLCKRTHEVPHHKGQICFPGGSKESGDPSLLDTALREAEEEMGLSRGDVDVLGRMDPAPTLSHFLITPYVCEIPPGYEFTPDSFEVEEIFSVPLNDFLHFPRYRTAETVFKGGRHPVYFFDFRDKTIWGATAKILRMFAELVKERELGKYLNPEP